MRKRVVKGEREKNQLLHEKSLSSSNDAINWTWYTQGGLLLILANRLNVRYNAAYKKI